MGKYNHKNGISQQKLMEHLSYDKDNGLFTWLKPTSTRVKVNRIASCIDSHGYIRIGIGSIRYMAHRLAWLYVYGAFPSKNIDHINGITTDNRIDNLRDVDHGINIQNIKGARKDSAHGILGITKINNKWRAKIMLNGENIHLGYFDDKDKAHQAYLERKRIIHIGCTI